MRIYILVQNYEASYDYAWDYSPVDLVLAYTTREQAELDKHKMEEANGGETWNYEGFKCFYTIEEVNLKEVEPVENPNLVRSGWLGREAHCCGLCGNNLRFLANFCDKCGTSIKREDVENVNRSVHRRTTCANSKRTQRDSEVK